MTKKIVHLIICLSTCLSMGSLARPTLGSTTRSWAPTASPLPDQARSQPVLPAPAHIGFPGPRSGARAGVVRAGVAHLCRTDRCRQAQVRHVEKAGPPAVPPSDNDQDRTGRLIVTITISQPLSFYRPLEAVTSHPHYEVLLSPTMPVSISYEAVTGRYSAVLPRLFSGEPNHLVLPDESYTTQLGESLTGDAIRSKATCMVNSTADSGPDSLRSCLQNAQVGDTITFNTTIFSTASPATISLQSLLPTIITDALTIDASNAGVILDGSGLSSGPGLRIHGASRVQIRGLQIISFPWDGIALTDGAANNIIGGTTPGAGNLISGNKRAGIWLRGTGTTGNQIQGNFIGTDISGIAVLGNLGNGIFIGFGASNNVIGGTTPGAGNLISGNKDNGIQIQNPTATGNQIQGNFIGTDVSGTVALGNLNNGIFIGEASNNTVGGNTPGARNLISGNGYDGILLLGSDTTGNQILGNFIGINVTGTSALRNLRMGVLITSGASNNIIGGNTTGARNLISGNGYNGIEINGGATSNQVLGNFIGTDASGAVAIGNLRIGISILSGASNNIIGGSTSAARNLVSSNQGAGIWLGDTGTTGNRIQGDFIGTDVSGTAALGNLGNGIFIGDGASNNIIGGASLETGNLVSGNQGAGIWFEDTDTTGNQVLGNYIGTDVTGTTVLRNLQSGVVIGFGASNNIIGGATSGARNLVSGNQHAGIWLGETGTTDNQVLGNFIGTDVNGTAALGNRLAGIFIGFEASNNIIGGESPGTGNLISGNEDNGILLWGTGTTGNQVLGNFIGTDRYGTAALGNSPHGVFVNGGASNNLVGGETLLADNTIAFNDGDGVHIAGPQTLGNTISHNSIHNNGGLGIETTNGGNAELPPPTITTAISTSVSGQTGPNHIVEVFSDNDGEGRWFEGNAIADGSGVFTLTYSGVFRGCNLTATATDAGGNTSEFSTPFPVKDCSSRIFMPIIFKSSG